MVKKGPRAKRIREAMDALEKTCFPPDHPWWWEQDQQQKQPKAPTNGNLQEKKQVLVAGQPKKKKQKGPNPNYICIRRPLVCRSSPVPQFSESRGEALVKMDNGDTTNPFKDTPTVPRVSDSTEALLKKANGETTEPSNTVVKPNADADADADAANLADKTNPQLQLAILARISYEIRHLSSENLSKLTGFIQGEISFRERAQD